MQEPFEPQRDPRPTVASEVRVGPPSYPAPRSTLRRVRRTIRRIDPWTVLKLSAVFYVSVMLIFLLAGAIIYFAAAGAGIIGKMEAFVQGIGWPEFQIRPIQVFRVGVLIGLMQVIFWSGVNLFAAFLYNLVADLVGGIELTMSEREI
ncbi:MAG: DUF3566 domain-containing protein [Actinomycetota bacterium]